MNNEPCRHCGEYHSCTELIDQQADRIAELEKTLSILEGEYPEPTINAKIKEFNSLEEAYSRIAELEEEQTEDLKSAGKIIVHLRDRIAELEKDGKVCATCGGLVYDPVLIQPSKQLSDEEIMKHSYLTSDNDPIAFARAIIKEITE